MLKAMYFIAGTLVVINAYPRLPAAGKVALFVLFPFHVGVREIGSWFIKNW